MLQRVKTEEERAAEQRSKARAQKTIEALGNNLKENLNKHIFEALPAEGGQADHNDPSGLHAYTNKKLPNTITKVGDTQGTASKVHSLTWRWNDSEVTKVSTMFPTWMPETHVRTLIALEYPNTRDKAVGNDVKLWPEDTKAFIKQGHTITLNKSGNTVYPVM